MTYSRQALCSASDMFRRLCLAGLFVLSLSPAAPPAAQMVFHRLIVRVGANKSNNWSGYNQGTVEKGGKMFNRVSGTWGVPIVGFNNSMTNGQLAGLIAAEEIQLVDTNGAALAIPSAPDPDGDAFNVCAFATSCPTPAGP